VPARLRSALPYLAVAAAVIGTVNFSWLFAESASLGGDAVNGYQLDGHYFVGSHGSYTEVSRTAWEWSQLHAMSLVITHPLAMLGMAVLLFGFVFPRFMAGAGGADNAGRTSLVLGSGPEIASTRCAGMIGAVQFSGPLLRVSVYPSGILVKPMFMRQGAILASEISAVKYERKFLAKMLEVNHSGVDSMPPLRLNVGERSAVATAIKGLNLPADRMPPPMGLAPGPRRADRLEMILGAFGVLVSATMIIVGVLWAIPQLGPFGFVWTAFAIGITALNARRWWRSSR
jgi:hypothetical protein